MLKHSKIEKILILFILAGLMLIIAFPGAEATFPDLKPNHWCYQKILDYADLGYINGYENGEFRADKTISRAEYVTIVNNFFGYQPDKEAMTEFLDVDNDAWFAPYVAEAVKRGYISGYPDKTFRPYEPIRRQEATAILSSILKINEEVYEKDDKNGLAQYLDGDKLEEWAYTAVQSYTVHDFINGYEDNTIRLLQNVTRAETVQLLNTVEEKIIIDREEKPNINEDKVISKRVTTPTIILKGIEEYEDESQNIILTRQKVIADGSWVNGELAFYNIDDEKKPLARIEVTTKTKGAIISYRVMQKNNEIIPFYIENIENGKAFYLPDGVYEVKASATKSNYKKSFENSKIIKIDTVAPMIEVGDVPQEENNIEVTITDLNNYNANEISGIDTASVKYAWFVENEDSGYILTKEGFRNLELTDSKTQISIPTDYGRYKLAVSVCDNARNCYGREFTIIGGEEIKFDFVKDIEVNVPKDPEDEPEEDTPEDRTDVIIKAFTATNYPDKNAIEAEPGNIINYNLKLENKEATEAEVGLKLQSDGVLSNSFVITYKGIDGNIIKIDEVNSIDKIVIPALNTVEFAFSAKVQNEYKINSDFSTSAKITNENEEELATAIVTNAIEKSVSYAAQNLKSKNVILILDLSGSMGLDVNSDNYGKSSRIEVLKNTAKIFIDKLKSDSTANNSDITLTLLGVGAGQAYDKSGMIDIMGNDNETRAYKIGSYTKESWVKKNLYKKLIASGGTNITGALKLAQNIIKNEQDYRDIYDINYITKNSENIVILLTDGANGPYGDVRITGKESQIEYLKNNSSLFAIEFGPDATDINSDGYKDLLAITGDSNLIYRASDEDALNSAFKAIATKISKQQSVRGSVMLDLPEDGDYYPIIFTHEVDGADKRLFMINSKEELELNTEVEVRDNKLYWDLSGDNYSDKKNLKVL